MSFKDTDVKTPGEATIAKKFKLPVAKVKQLVKVGAEHEKEHNTNIEKAKQVARDHIGERPDYYKMLKKAEKTKVKVEEGKVKDIAKKAVRTAIVGSNLMALGTAADPGSTKDPGHAIVQAASALPGAAGWAATGAHYAKKAYDKVKQMKEGKDPCWKGYEQVGMKKKGGKKVPNCVPVKEEQIDEISAELVGKVSNARWRRGETPSKTLANAIKKKFIESGKKKESKKEQIKELAMSMPPNVEMPVPGLRRQASASQQRLQGNTYRAGQSFSSQGSNVKPSNMRMGSNYGTMKPTSTQVTRNISNRFNPSFGQNATGSMKPSSVGGSTSFSQGGTNIGSKMAASKQTSQVVKGMATSGRQAALGAAQKAAGSVAGRALGALSGPVGAAVTAAAPALGSAMKQSHQTGHASFTQHSSSGEKASSVFDRMRSGSQGRSVSQYEKDVLTPKAAEAPKASETPRQTVNAPAPPERPKYFSRGQAFGAARSEVGGSGGSFSYDNKSYQTNVRGEPYKPSSSLKQTSIKEETKMDNKELINEAIDNIMEENLPAMKENLMLALQEKAMEKLEERKKEIASNYFAQ